MTAVDDTTWQDVGAVLVTCWPAGPGNKGWEREHVDAYVEELKLRKLTAYWAVRGLRASKSDFIPSVGGVLRLAHEAMPPMTVEEINAAQERVRARSRERMRQAMPHTPPEIAETAQAYNNQ